MRRGCDSPSLPIRLARPSPPASSWRRTARRSAFGIAVTCHDACAGPTEWARSACWQEFPGGQGAALSGVGDGLVALTGELYPPRKPTRGACRHHRRPRGSRGGPTGFPWGRRPTAWRGTRWALPLPRPNGIRGDR